MVSSLPLVYLGPFLSHDRGIIFKRSWTKVGSWHAGRKSSWLTIPTQSLLPDYSPVTTLFTRICSSGRFGKRHMAWFRSVKNNGLLREESRAPWYLTFPACLSFLSTWCGDKTLRVESSSRGYKGQVHIQRDSIVQEELPKSFMGLWCLHQLRYHCLIRKTNFYSSKELLYKTCHIWR